MNPYPSQNPIRTTARKVTTATNQTKPAQVHRVVGPVAEDVGVDGVEDHRLVRHVVARALRAAGHFVLEADSAEQALDVLDNAHIDAAVLDFSLPGDMNGLQLGRCMRYRDPRLPIVFVSGLTDWEIQDVIPTDPETRFLRKPFGARVIVDMVQGLLSARSGFSRVQPAG